MEKEQIRKLFKQGYNRNFWTQFLGQTFVGTQLYIEPEILTGINTNVAANAHKLGYINVNDDNIERQIGVFEVELSQGIILERNRVGLRNMLRSYWRDMDGAFIVYYHPNSTIKKWRFTYVSELAGYDAEGEYTKIVTEPKRYTYVLGQGESVRTATERFSQLAAKGSNATIDDIKEAFSVEKLSKSFFDEYKRHYQIFNDYILSSPQARGCFSDYTADKEKDIRDFTKKMLGRIIFLYFIQKKGWLGVPVDGKWGEGDFNFLSRLFETHDTTDTFYNEKLVKLFFETLNKERPNDEIELIEGERCRVPYLNGGLFEAEDSNRQRIIFDGELFRNLFEFFNQYNFTIYEDDPNDHTVAVDPEMLGHIFENLLEDNKDKGAFYTPKEIVHYMCQESLIEYLSTWFEDKGYEVTSYAALGNEREPSLFSSAETSKQLTIETTTNGKRIDRLLIEKLLKKQLDDDNRETVIQHSSEFHQALDKVKVCDPAIGSGAFPMGLLQEIFTTKETLWNFEHGNLIDFPASEVKLNIIQNSIYGVDIEKGAVDIARLRFWLSLVVDEETPKALPNLDYKIVTGNSLVSKLDDTIIDIDWVTKDLSHGLFVDELVKKRETLLQTIVEKQKDFFDPHSDKKTLSSEIKKHKIDLLINQLGQMVKRKGTEVRPSGSGKTVAAKTEIYLQTLEWKDSIKKLKTLKEKPDQHLNFFDWKLNFPEVLNEAINPNPGFDIVIANPPYLKERDNAHIFNVVNKSRIGKLYHQGKMDYWYYFLHLAIDITKFTSTVSFITSRYWINGQGAQKLIKRIQSSLYFTSIIDIGKLKVFDNVVGQHMIHTYSRSKKNNFYYKKIENNIDEITRINRTSNSHNNNLFHEQVFIDNEIILTNNNIKFHTEYTLGDKYEISQGVIEAPDKVSSKQLSNLNDKNIKVGDGIFVLTGGELEALNLSISEMSTIKKYLDPNDVEAYKINPVEKKFLIYSDKETKIKIANDKNYNNIKSHLDFYKNFISSSNRPYGIHRPRKKIFFSNKKILFKGMFTKNEFAIDVDKYYVGMSFISIIEKEKDYNLEFLLGLLNSKFALNWFYTFGKKRGGGVDIGVNKLRTFPLPTYRDSKIETLVESITLSKKLGKETFELERELDYKVYSLYRLNYVDIKKIDPNFGLTEEEYKAIKIE